MLTNIHYKTASDFITLLLRRSDHADHQGAKGFTFFSSQEWHGDRSRPLRVWANQKGCVGSESLWKGTLVLVYRNSHVYGMNINAQTYPKHISDQTIRFIKKTGLLGCPSPDLWNPGLGCAGREACGSTSHWPRWKKQRRPDRLYLKI